MSAQTASTRLAGEALRKFHEVGSGLISSKIAERIGPTLGATATQFIEPASQLAGSAAIAGAESVLDPLFQKKKTEAQEYARQAYVPGTVPLTNEQAGYLYLDQIKTQNQLALLQARQTASVPTRMAPMYGAVSQSVAPEINPIGDPYGGLMGALNTTYTY